MFVYDVFLICPVRDANEDQKKRMTEYIANLEHQGLRVYYPARDTYQVDHIGFRICTDNTKAIRDSAEIHIFYDPESRGTLFDLGVAFALKKKLIIVNTDEVAPTDGKSFANMIIEWSKQ